jgi:chaperone modulatory protein CbpM
MDAARRPPARQPSSTTVGSERPRGRYLLGSPTRMSLDEFARSAGLHPDMARRFVALGLVEASRDAAGNLWFTPAQLVKVARARRLRAGLSLNYAAIGLVIDLLERIDELEAALRRAGEAGTIPAGPTRTRVRPSAPRRRE